MAIGNPFGLEATVTVGVLSGKGRVIGAGPYDDFLQTDTSINPGNSGGPLFNIEGEVVGINTAIIRGGQGIGFSIPINLAKSVATQLKENGKVERGFIGVGIQTLTPALKSALSIPTDVSGALVSYVMEDGPAKEAGLEPSDVVVSVNNNPVATANCFGKWRSSEPGPRHPLRSIETDRRRRLPSKLPSAPSKRSGWKNNPRPSPPRLMVFALVWPSPTGRSGGPWLPKSCPTRRLPGQVFDEAIGSERSAFGKWSRPANLPAP